jgi:hypothetical protein
MNEEPNVTALVSTAAQETEARTNEARAVRAALEDFSIVTKEEIETASGLLVDIKGRSKALEDRMSEITRPINAALKSIRDLFRPAISAYEEAEVLLKRRISDAYQAIERANQEAMRAAQAQMEQGNVLAAAQVASSLVEKPATEGVRTQEVFTFRVVNALLVPREFLVVDEKKIRAYISIHQDQKPIPGVSIEKDVRIVAARGR